MKRFVFLIFFFSLFASCKADTDFEKKSEEISCSNYRKAMRDFVIQISNTARQSNENFIVIPQNGQNVAWDDEDNIIPDPQFFKAIDGTGREDTFYGMNSSYEIADGKKTPENMSLEIQEMCDVYKDAGLSVLSIDYTTAKNKYIEDSYSKNAQKGYISFAATQRKLNIVPSYEPYNKNSNDITKLSEARNFLYLINPEKYSSKESFISALAETDYDLFIIDLFCAEEILTPADLARLKTKNNGGRRLVICYMSIGEAEDYRWYWKDTWNKNPPAFMCPENPEWEGNYKVKYWYPSWQEIICGKDGYLSKIVNAGFDGVYLDIIDAFEYFEEQVTK